MHNLGAELDRAYAVVQAIDNREPMSTPDLVALWLDVDHLARELGQVLKLLHEDASDRVFTEIPDVSWTYTSSVGEPVHLARGYAAERWSGYELADRLAVDVVDPETGELLRAVPVEVVRRHVPGCATADTTSSKWRTTGLAELVPDWRRYRSRDEAPLVLRRGERP